MDMGNNFINDNNNDDDAFSHSIGNKDNSDNTTNDINSNDSNDDFDDKNCITITDTTTTDSEELNSTRNITHLIGKKDGREKKEEGKGLNGAIECLEDFLTKNDEGSEDASEWLEDNAFTPTASTTTIPHTNITDPFSISALPISSPTPIPIFSTPIPIPSVPISSIPMRSSNPIPLSSIPICSVGLSGSPVFCMSSYTDKELEENTSNNTSQHVYVPQHGSQP